MGAPVPSYEPSEFVAGDTVSWKISLPNFPASAGWVLSYEAKNSAGKLATITAAADGDDHLVTIAPATSGNYAAGSYAYNAYATLAGARHRVRHGSWKVLPNLAAAGALDTRSHAVKVLEAIEAVIEGRATKQQASYIIGGRSLAFIPHTDLLALRSSYQKEVRREQDAERIRKGLGGRGRIRTRFL